jgi:phage antirepressor YoqD-like protein
MVISLKKLMSQQQLLRKRVLEIMTRESKSLFDIAKDMKMSPTTLRRWLIHEKDVEFKGLSKIISYLNNKELEIEKTTENNKKQNNL